MTLASDSQVAAQVLRGYEERPYPATDGKPFDDRRGALAAPIEWINALWKPGQAVGPRRILVAGCGTGEEAFHLAQRFPDARIVAIDFSPWSISLAKKSQSGSPRMSEIRFAVADLTREGLSRLVGSDFDFISCHGVLSYIPRPERALQNLRACMRADGVLYLGVNGAVHASVGGRRALRAFGLNPAKFTDTPQLRKLLRLCDAIAGRTGFHRLANQPADYLAGDLFGPLIQNRPLSSWIRLARKAQLYLQGSYAAHHDLARAAGNGLPAIFMSKSRPELCQFVEDLAPASFHSLVFARRAAVDPPWRTRAALLSWHPVWTGLYACRLPNPSRRRPSLRRIVFKSVATNTLVEYQMPDWEVEILRQSDGRSSLGEILQGVPFNVPSRLVAEQLYRLSHLLIIQLRPPA